MTIQIEKIHHVAYRCKDAKETVEWYKNLNMDFILAFAEDHVRLPRLLTHICTVLDAGNGNVLAFFELPTQPEMGRDENTPKWVQHIALKVKDRQALVQAKEHLEANGVMYWALPITAFSIRFTSLIQMATVWNWHMMMKKHPENCHDY